jgi:hypothetical protein
VSTPRLFETLQSTHDDGGKLRLDTGGVLKPMRGGTRKGAETERGKPRRDKRQERNSRQAPGNTGPGGRDYVSAAIPGVATVSPQGGVGKQQEGQMVSQDAGGYHGGEPSEGGNLGGIGMKKGRKDTGGRRRREAEKA